MKIYYSITPISFFTSSEDEIDLGFCLLKKFTKNDLKEAFETDKMNSDSYRYWVGDKFPTEAEFEMIFNSTDAYFLCFLSKDNHDEHFNYVAKALTFLDHWPAKIGKSFADGMRDSWGNWLLNYNLEPDLENIPERDIPKELKLIHVKITKEKPSENDMLGEKYYYPLLLWRKRKFRKLFLDPIRIEEFTSLEAKFKKLFDENSDDTRLNRLAVNLYLIAQDNYHLETRIVFACLILESLFEIKESRGKGNKLASYVADSLQALNDPEKKVKKFIKKIYNIRSDILHGKRYREHNLEFNDFDIERAYDIIRRIILSKI